MLKNFNSSKKPYSNLIFFAITFAFLSLSCNDKKLVFKSYRKTYFTTPSSKKVTVYIAESYKEQKRGLSGIKPQEFSEDEAMLFPATKMDYRQFWMPETYMDLDLFFMTEDYYIIEVHRNLKHFTKRHPESLVPRSKTVYSQHVLEMKSSSKLAKELMPGMKIILK